MRIVHLLDWPPPRSPDHTGRGAAAGSGAAVAAAAIRRRPDLEHIVIAVGPAPARHWAASAGLDQSAVPIVPISPPTGRLGLGAPAIARALRSAGDVDIIHAWSARAGAVGRRIRPARARLYATALAPAPRPRPGYPRRLRPAPPIDALITPCPAAAARARSAHAAIDIIHTAIPRLDHAGGIAPHPAPGRDELRRALGLAQGDCVILLVGEGPDDADAARFMVACALAGASGRRVCALIGARAAQRRRGMRIFENSRNMLDCRATGDSWRHLAPAADLGMIAGAGDGARDDPRDPHDDAADEPARDHGADNGTDPTTATAAVSLAAALALGLPVIAPAPIYRRLGIAAPDAPQLVSAGWTRAELARLAGPLIDDPALARAARDRAAQAASPPGADFFDAIDRAWARAVAPRATDLL